MMALSLGLRAKPEIFEKMSVPGHKNKFISVDEVCVFEVLILF